MYVDILLASSKLSLLYETKYYFSKNFEMKDICETSFVIGFEIFLDKK